MAVSQSGEVLGSVSGEPCAVLGKPFPAELLIAEVKRCLAPRGRS
jgi:hypothetical protein